MPVAGGPFIQKTGILLEVDAANAASYPGTGTTWANLFRPGTFNGTITGSVTYNSTDVYGALQFPANNSYVDFGNVGDLSVSWSFQVAVKPAPSASGNYTILSYTSGSGTGSLTFKLDYSSSNQVATLSSYSATGSTQIVHRVTGSVSTGSWSIINASYGSSVIGMFVNGRPTDYAVTTGSTVGYSANNKLVAGGTNLVTSSYYSGSLSNILVYNADVANARIVQNYNAFATRFGLPPSTLFPYVTDPDAFRFIEVANITSSVQAAAINTLVLGLKSNTLWDKMQVIYPFIGGNAFSHKWNLKNPSDNDAAYRIQYSGVVNHSSNGVSSGGGYIETYFNPSDITPPSSSFHFSAYIHTTSSTNDGWILGNDWLSGIMYVTQYSSGNIYLSNIFQSYNQFVDTYDERGYHIMSRTDTTLATVYRYLGAGNFTDSNGNAFGNSNDNSIRILSVPTRSTYNGILNCVTFGSGLTATETSTMNTLIRNFNTSLSRNVV
jgi:hypothetical protein